MVSGPYFELWLLKVVWGAIEAGAMQVDGRTAYRFRLGVPSKEPTEVLWRGAEWPKAWGLYVPLDRDHDRPAIPKSIRLRMVNDGSEILGAHVQIVGFEFLISFEVPPVRRICRPCSTTFSRVGFPPSSYKMIALAWPDLGHDIINAESQVPPNEDYTISRSPRAAAMHGRIAPGSLSVAPVPGVPRLVD